MINGKSSALGEVLSNSSSCSREGDASAPSPGEVGAVLGRPLLEPPLLRPRRADDPSVDLVAPLESNWAVDEFVFDLVGLLRSDTWGSSGIEIERGDLFGALDIDWPCRLADAERVM